MDGDLSHAETQRRGEFFSRKERIDRKGWKRVRLGDVLSYEQPYSYIVNNREYSKAGTPVLTPGKTFILGYTQETHGLCHATPQAPRILFDDFLTISRLVEFDFKVKSSAVKILSPTSEDCNLRFLFYAMSQLRFDVVDHQRHWIGQFSKLEIAIPKRYEQDKIAAAIMACDTHIAALQSLIAKYEAIKKATVNLLLKPKAGWRHVKLGDICLSFAYGVGASAIPYDGTNRYIRITDIDDDSHKFKPSPLSSPSHFRYDHIVKDGDILIARTGASVGKSYIYHQNDGKLIFAGFLMRAAINHGLADPYFIFLQTLTNKYRLWVAEESMRSGQPGLNINQCKGFEFFLPKISEQRKIASQITAIDKVLNDCKKQLDKAKTLKQGMMSYFFG